MRIVLVLGLVMLANLAPALAQAPSAPIAPPTAEMRSLETVVVTGIRPGPRLWKVSKGEHALWILGTVSPVPADMEWYSPQSEAVLGRAQEIIGRPHAGGHVTWANAFKAALAMPAILRARKNPDGKTLRDVLPADLYARWTALKPKYLANDQAVEQWRPIFAAGKLYEAALDKAGLVSGTGTGKRIGELAKARKIKQTSNMISQSISDPKGLAKAFAAAEVNDVPCFRSVLDRLELDVAHATSRANAWAVGDMAELGRLVRRDRIPTCLEAFAKVEALRTLGILDANERAEAKWLLAVDAALAANHTSFAALPMSEMLEADGLLARLRAKGYEVSTP